VIIKRLENIPRIEENKRVRVKECGNIIEIMSRERYAHGPPTTIKITKEQYVDTRTGEVKQFKHNKTRADDLKSVARSLALGRDMLNANIDDVSRCRWLTLTYADNMTDTKKLMYDFKNFNKRCRERFGHYEYITAAEPQGRGAWHLHCVLIFDGKAPYMPNEVVADLWKQGFVTVKMLDDVDNVGAYLTAYLGDMELSEANAQGITSGELKTVEYEENGEKKSKRYIKGARLHMYPPKFNIFRYSRGCKRPIVTYEKYAEVKKKVCGGAQTFSKAVVLVDDDSDFTDTIVYEYYNSVRK
jgi:hypothetical protein